MADRIWAGWRMQYVAGLKDGVCVFCDRPTQPPENDDANLIMRRDARCFIMMNRYPYSNGHLMIIPYEHAASLVDLPRAVLHEMIHLTQLCEQVLQQVYAPDGFNIGINLGAAAGAGIANHLHMHIVPRWVGDSNFITTLGNVRVIPEFLEDTYRRLKPVFESLSAAGSKRELR
ncbi:MAG: HIT domain-containing protein [Candidatus Tectomicrobia bacterium]|nr:HIT domain-containing protein [Candidatus Tectomicrobia bacterium]